jgi:type IV pilus assembly protein PilB
VVEAVNSIIFAAIKEKASDIHVEPMKNTLRVRLRIDGVLTPYKDFPLDLMPPMISRIKIMAGADIAEKRRHQDGRILFETPEGALDMRVNFYATVGGEKVVMRLLNKQALLLDIKQIGMFPRMLQMFMEEALDSSSGVILVTGPTGSGKTTTLYSAINYLDNIDVSIVTAEDPVEYIIDGIAQCSLNAKIKLTFEESLKHMMRQDPDIIVVGEIRDRNSAEAAIQAALTGHKVLTTFHTEDSIGGLIRLLNMNIEAFLISSTVVSVLAQRLLRRVCPACAEDHPLTSHEIRRLGYKSDEFKGVVFKKGRGCKQCRFTGYRGRVPVFELLVLNEMVKDALIAKKTSYEIRRISSESAGLVTLLEDGIIKAAAGLTTFDEIMRQLPRLSPPRSFSELRRLQGELV